MNKTEPLYKICFTIEGMESYGNVPWLEKAMQQELMRGYNLYAEKANVITEDLNNEFSARHPEYFKKNKDKEWHELTLYNNFMARGYNSKICDELNRNVCSELLEYFVSPEEVDFRGRLRQDNKVVIQFYLKVAN